jgi:hypothetical protein
LVGIGDNAFRDRPFQEATFYDEARLLQTIDLLSKIGLRLRPLQAPRERVYYRGLPFTDMKEGDASPEGCGHCPDMRIDFFRQI